MRKKRKTSKGTNQCDHKEKKISSISLVSFNTIFHELFQ